MIVGSGCAACALDLDAFSQEVEQRVAAQRPQWSKVQQRDLAVQIVTELATKMPEGLSQSVASKVLEHLESDLRRISVGQAPDEEAVTITQEYFRWAIADYAGRKAMTDAQVAELEAGVRECFARATKMLKNQIPAALHDVIDRSAMTNLTYTLRSIRDPLFPGLKRSLTQEKYEECLREFENLRKHQQQQREQVERFREQARQLAQQAGATNMSREPQWSDDLEKVSIEGAFLHLRSLLEYSGVTLPEAMQQATAKSAAKHRDQYENKRACFMNLRNFGFALRLHVTGDEQEVFRQAGSFLADTNFFVRSQVRWRFSRDGIYPACRLSPSTETVSYEGLQTTNLVLSNSSPVAWERKPYHDNQRHVLFFDGHVELVPEDKFQALTNAAPPRK